MLINQKESLVALNTVILINVEYSSMRIYSYRDNYFIPHFNACSEILNDNKILVVGGLSVPTLLENFNYTPIFIINLCDFTVSRIIPEFNYYPGIIFNHKIHLLSKDKFQILEGFTITNANSLNIIQESQKQESKVEKNTSSFEFDFIKKTWKLSLNTFKI